MRPLKKLNPFKKYNPSIAKADPTKPSLEALVEKKLFFPTFDSRNSILFWLGFIIFFSLLGMLSNTALFRSRWEAWVFFVEGITSYACIVGFVVGYIHLNRYTLVHYNYKQTIQFFLKAILLLVPIATFISSYVTYLITDVARDWQTLWGFVVSNIALSIVFSFLMVHFFSSQYDRMQQHQISYQKKLIEQNEQLKARITPHFFFNMLNTIQSLVESEPALASEALDKMAKLYRFSFYEPKEIALTDEIELCEDYLDIERHRFKQRLRVTWDLPDEDMLYDMVITSLTLQMLIEKMIISVVEITNQTIQIHIGISWENGVVDILITTQLPDNFSLEQAENLTKHLSFQTQENNLQRFFGKAATVRYQLDIKKAIAKNIILTIQYPLLDVS